MHILYQIFTKEFLNCLTLLASAATPTAGQTETLTSLGTSRYIYLPSTSAKPQSLIRTHLAIIYLCKRPLSMGLFWAFPIFFSFPLLCTAHIATTRRIADETDPSPGVLDRQGCILLGPLRCRFEFSTDQ